MHATIVDIEGKTPQKPKRFSAAHTQKSESIHCRFSLLCFEFRRGRDLRVQLFGGGTESRWHPSYRHAGEESGIQYPVLQDVLERNGLVVRTCVELVVFGSLFRVF